jgi:hypothetical protein
MTLQVQEQETDHWLRKMAQQLSGVTVVIIIAGGVLTCLLLFIFAKRQIMRFALRSHRGPHVPCGTDANKVSHLTPTPTSYTNNSNIILTLLCM